jgi:glycosyltransferase involved in cell wall biosynthesis
MLNVFKKVKSAKLVIAAKKEGIYSEVEDLSNDIDNIDFLGTIPVDDVIPLTEECHAIICMFDPEDKLNKIGSPNKLFEAMVTGRPIIVTDNTNAGNIVKKEKCGLAIGYSEEELENAIKYLKDHPKICEEMGKKGLFAAQNKYNWQLQEEKLIGIYDKLND